VLTNNPETNRVNDDWPRIFQDYDEMIRPFAKQLAAQTDLRDTELDCLGDNLSVALEEWFFHVLAQKITDVRVLLTNSRQKAAALHRELQQIDGIPEFLRPDVVGPELPHLIKLLEGDRWLRIYDENMHFGNLIDLMCRMIDPFYDTFLNPFLRLPASVLRKGSKLTENAISARGKGDVQRSIELFQQRNALYDSALEPKRGRCRPDLVSPPTSRKTGGRTLPLAP
jgi:hypothetical protein